MTAWHGGRDDAPRPLSVSEAQFGQNFDAIDRNARERAEAAVQAQIKAADDFAQLMRSGRKPEPTR